MAATGLCVASIRAIRNWVYSESQNGMIGRQNLKTGEQAGIRPRPVKQGEELRFNWNAPFILSSHNTSIFYSGAQYVFRSVARGADPQADQPGTDPHQAGVDDGARGKPEERGRAVGRHR